MDKIDYTKSVNEHYGRQGLGERILDGLRAAGKDIDNLTHHDLTMADHFHSRGRDATLELAHLADIRPGLSVLDVGGGIGGPARMLAAEFDCRVTVLDLTEEFCRVGEMLTERTALSDKVTFRVGNALDMPFPDASFDVVWTQHSSMNISDKKRLYSEAHRVLRPGGRLAIHEIMAGPEQPIHFPVPWAATPQISFLRPPDEIRALIEGAGFKEVAWVDVTRISLEWHKERLATAQAAEGASSPPVGLQLLVGESFGPAFKNLIGNLAEGRIVIIEAVFDRV